MCEPMAAVGSAIGGGKCEPSAEASTYVRTLATAKASTRSVSRATQRVEDRKRRTDCWRFSSGRSVCLTGWRRLGIGCRCCRCSITCCGAGSWWPIWSPNRSSRSGALGGCGAQGGRADRAAGAVWSRRHRGEPFTGCSKGSRTVCSARSWQSMANRPDGPSASCRHLRRAS